MHLTHLKGNGAFPDGVLFAVDVLPFLLLRFAGLFVFFVLLFRWLLPDAASSERHGLIIVLSIMKSTSLS